MRIQDSMCLEVFVEGIPEQCCKRGAGGSYSGGGSSGRSCPSVCIDIHLCWNKNEHRNSRAWYAPKGAEDAGDTGPIFFIFIVEEVFEDAPDPIFLTLPLSSLYLQFFTFCLTLTLYQPYESMVHWTKSSDLIN